MAPEDFFDRQRQVVLEVEHLMTRARVELDAARDASLYLWNNLTAGPPDPYEGAEASTSYSR